VRRKGKVTVSSVPSLCGASTGSRLAQPGTPHAHRDQQRELHGGQLSLAFH